jgi:hypothetical protein
MTNGLVGAREASGRLWSAVGMRPAIGSRAEGREDICRVRAAGSARWGCGGSGANTYPVNG